MKRSIKRKTLNIKEKILELRSQKKTYDEIVEILNCAKSTVAWHCSDKVKESAKKYKNTSRRDFTIKIKKAAGGKCKLCGYDKCFSSLVFHHLDPKTKEANISKLVKDRGFELAEKESKKCILICANCHGEVHEGLITVDII